MDLCQKVEQDYPYAHAIGAIRAIIGADWIKPAEKVKRVQSVLDELNQRVLERCAGAGVFHGAAPAPHPPAPVAGISAAFKGGWR